MDCEKAMAAVLAICPKPEFGEDDHGGITIITNIKTDIRPSAPAPAILTSKCFLQSYMRFQDYCEEHGPHLETVREALRDSESTFGNYANMLVQPTPLCRRLDIKPLAEDLYTISVRG